LSHSSAYARQDIAPVSVRKALIAHVSRARRTGVSWDRRVVCVQLAEHHLSRRGALREYAGDKIVAWRGVAWRGQAGAVHMAGETCTDADLTSLLKLVCLLDPGLTS
jgi:hypothetical protein